MSKVGRPLGSSKASTRKVVFGIRFSDSERKLIRRKARASAVAPTIWMRSVILAEVGK